MNVLGGCLSRGARFSCFFVPVLLKIYKKGLASSDFSLELVAEFLFGFIFAVRKPHGGL